MAAVTKSTESKIVARVGGFPPEPLFSPEALANNKDLADWQRQFDLWYPQFTRAIGRRTATTETAPTPTTVSESVLAGHGIVVGSDGRTVHAIKDTSYSTNSLVYASSPTTLGLLPKNTL